MEDQSNTIFTVLKHPFDEEKQFSCSIPLNAETNTLFEVICTYDEGLSDKNLRFLVNDILLVTSIEEHCEKFDISTEETLTIVAFEPELIPENHTKISQPDWISRIKSNDEFLMVGCFDGTFNVYDTDLNEVFSHTFESRIVDFVLIDIDLYVLLEEGYFVKYDTDRHKERTRLSLSILPTSIAVCEKLILIGDESGNISFISTSSGNVLVVRNVSSSPIVRIFIHNEEFYAVSDALTRFSLQDSVRLSSLALKTSTHADINTKDSLFAVSTCDGRVCVVTHGERKMVSRSVHSGFPVATFTNQGVVTCDYDGVLRVFSEKAIVPLSEANIAHGKVFDITTFNGSIALGGEDRTLHVLHK
ncbi:hypothetical protein PCE1_000153 [Barthelona sp. PCE]